jgi:DNA-binding response OmpR family regulator
MVLVIDDTIDLQQLVRIALKSKGYQVETANNGLEGLKKLETLSPDLIILDMNMPKMGGLEFYQKICDGENHPPYPVLILTARANMEQLFKELDIDGFMAKPFEVDELLAQVDAIIKKKSEGIKDAGTRKKGRILEVCIAENNQESFDNISRAFLNAGYVVNPARSGTEAIERIATKVPDIALIHLGLMDIAGDVVILRIKKMAKTQNVPCILYTRETADKTAVTEKISRKEGVVRFVVSSDAKQLVMAVNETLNI